MSSFAVWLYGSEARGDSLPDSDVDILVIGAALPAVDLSARYPGRRISVSYYDWQDIRQMAEYGSLFLHHIRLEGKRLFESAGEEGRLLAEMVDLPCYRHARRDVRAFHQSLLDIRYELPKPPDLAFELATLAALLRRIGILGCYLLGSPLFSRFEPVRKVVEAWALPHQFTLEFPELYQFRLAADNSSVVTPKGDIKMLEVWLERAGSFLEKLEGQTHEFYNALSHSHSTGASTRR